MSSITIPALTGLRAFAAAIVFFGHILTPHYDVVPGLLQYGWAGVNIFFALSGYLFQHLYSETLIRGTFSWWEYIKRRLIRIYPITSLVVVLSAISAWDRITMIDIGLHLTLLHGWHPKYRLSLNAPMWTLTLEESYYLMAPVMIYCLRKFSDDLRKRLAPGPSGLLLVKTCLVALLVWILSFALGRGLASYHQDLVYQVFGLWDWDVFSGTIFGRLSDFVAGMLAASLMSMHVHRLKGRGDLIVAIGVFLFFCSAGFIHTHGGATGVGEHKFGSIAINGLGAAGAIIIAGLHAGGWFSRLLSSRVAVVLGECSFALYLIQFMPVGPFPKISMALQGGLEASGLHFLLAALTSYLIMNVAALLLHRLYERPLGIAMRRKWLKRGA